MQSNLVFGKKRKVILQMAEGAPRTVELFIGQSDSSHVTTLVIAARCQDGVVMMSDSLLYDENTRKFNCGINKIFEDMIPNVVIGYSGAFHFDDHLREKIEKEKLSNDPNRIPTNLNAFDRVRVIARPINQDNSLPHADMIIARQLPNGAKSDFQYIDKSDDVISWEQHRQFPMGSGGLFTDNLFKDIWSENMTSEQVIELGWFAIGFLEKYFPEMRVGITDPDRPREVHRPQVMFLKDGGMNITKFTPDKMNEFESHTETRLKEFFKLGYRLVLT